MAKLSAPLLGFAGSGTVGGEVTFSSHRGTPYARRRVSPKTSHAVLQVLERQMLTWMNGYFHHAGPLALEPWRAGAKGRPLSAWNLLASNQMSLKTFRSTSSNGMRCSPKGKSVFVSSMTVVPGVGSITAGIVSLPLPAAWTIDQTVYIALFNETMHNKFVGPVLEFGMVGQVPSFVITGLTSGQDYTVHGFYRFLTPDGRVHYTNDSGSHVIVL